jgi:Arc/MetJ family transcription regulator
MYHFMNGWFVEPGTIPLVDFARSWLSRVEHGRDIWHHLLSWWAQRDNPNVLLLTYENVTNNPRAAIRRIAEFIDVDLDDDLLALTEERSSLSYMLEHKSKFSDLLMRRATVERCGVPLESDAAKVRQGGSGSGIKELSADLAAEVDALWAKIVEPVIGAASYQTLVATLA